MMGEQKIEIPSAAATATGDIENEVSNLPPHDSKKQTVDAMSNYAKPAHKAAARVVCYALSLGDAEAFAALRDVMVLRLNRAERTGLAWAALKSLEADDTTALFYCIGVGQPMNPYINYMDEATFWADMAEPAELDAYCLATFNRMTPARQSAFLNYVQGRAAA